MTGARNRRRPVVVAALLLLAAVARVAELSPLLPSRAGGTPPTRGRRRRIAQSAGPPDVRRPATALYPWARDLLRPLGFAPAPGSPALFWHVPQSGGRPIQFLYECMGQTLAGPAGAQPRFGHQRDDRLATFAPYPRVSKARYVNVDTTSKRGVQRAREWGLVPSGLADIIVTHDPKYALENLFDRQHKGRIFALFRHPVERLVSRFYHLQTATWESQYRPQWQNIDILEYAEKRNTDNDHLVKRLAGLGANETATRWHLQRAMHTVRRRFVVGLTEQMEESVHRFNLALGIDEAEEGNARCLEHFFQASVGAKRQHSDASKKVDPGSPAWKVLSETNKLDMRLYNYLQKVFVHQKDKLESYGQKVFVQQRDRIESYGAYNGTLAPDGGRPLASPTSYLPR